MLEWTRSDLNPRYVYVWYAGQDYVNMKNPSYKGRTSLFTDELKRGNISLKLSNVTPADEGKYRCYIPDRNEESVIELVVGAVSSPGISLTGLDKCISGMVLQCESEGWYPEPEVLWLDSEGNVLSAGPTETVRGPDDLYTVSSRVTVDKRHGHRFTCRVQQNIINQTRETHIDVPGQSRLIGSPQPVVAKVGDDIILPCHLEPAVDIATKMLEWTRSDLKPTYVYIWYAGQDYVNMKNLSYKGRTSLFTDELKRGNISLKLSNVKLADEGKYRCYIPDRNEESFIDLVVGAVSLPGISLAGLDKSSSEVVLQCESKGWYPEPEVLWLDVEGNVLSAGPTETVRGPDDLYTVSSSVTVDKRHGNIFTCRVQQNNINQTRETHIHVPDDFFKLQSRSSATTVGLVFSLVVCIMLILLLLLLLWKKNMSKRNQMDEVESKDQNNDNAETELLTKDKKETKQMERSQAVAAWSFSSLLEGKLTKTTNKLQEEKKKRQEEVKTLKNQLKELREKKESVDKKLMETSEELKQTQDKLRVHSRSSFHILEIIFMFYTPGQSRLIGSPQPVVAKVGDDVILPCHLEPAVDVATKTLEWTRPDLKPIFVYIWYAGQDYEDMKNPSYKGRTSLLTDELKRGNISLKLSNVTPADEGKYRCYIPDRNEESVIELVVGAVSSPGISLAGLDKSTSEVVLQCESKGWYPEPEVLWLDVEGNILSAGPTETVRGPDDLYNVSSRVTVDKRHGHRFTCRVQQNNINQTRETHIHVPGQSRLVSSPQPVVAKVGDDIILPCHLEPAVDVATKTLEWTRPDLDPRYVYVQRSSQDYVDMKNPSYKGRTSLFTDELKRGNISLKLSNVKLADEGKYRCYIPDRNEESFIDLVVGAVSSPGISLAGTDESSSGVVLQCESKGWYPEPEVFWLDSEGNVLSAGRTETVRGPDDLYNVSSRVTVDKRRGNTFTCRVQQNIINETRETQIYVPDDFFKKKNIESEDQKETKQLPFLSKRRFHEEKRSRVEAQSQVQRLKNDLETTNQELKNQRSVELQVQQKRQETPVFSLHGGQIRDPLKENDRKKPSCCILVHFLFVTRIPLFAMSSVASSAELYVKESPLAGNGVGNLMFLSLSTAFATSLENVTTIDIDGAVAEQVCSMGFKLGDQAGQSILEMSSSSKNSVTSLDRCGQALSSISPKSGHIAPAELVTGFHPISLACHAAIFDDDKLCPSTHGDPSPHHDQ
ncbi:hypothetical protein Q8A73_012695 [Channa argus]|nr:hypothetical protein Q8A73_012695 [Channa argus]